MFVIAYVIAAATVFACCLVTVAYVGADTLADLRRRRFGWAAVGLVAAVVPAGILLLIGAAVGAVVFS